MKDIPNPFWAACFIVLACILAVVALFAPQHANTGEVITMATSIITGAFGYIQGHKDGVNSQNPTTPAPPEK